MNTKIRSLLVVLLLTPAALFAAKAEGPKAKAMAKYDLNHDGKLDDAEIAAIQKEFAANPKGDLAHFDTNKDGKLSAEEIAKMIPGSGKKGGDRKEKAGEKSDPKKDAPVKAEDTK